MNSFGPHPIERLPVWIQRQYFSVKSTRITELTACFRTEKPIATVQAASAQDVDTAVQAASKALKHPSWKLLSGTDRGKLMSKLADLIEKRKELLASIDAWDNGKFWLPKFI